MTRTQVIQAMLNGEKYVTHNRIHITVMLMILNMVKLE